MYDTIKRIEYINSDCFTGKEKLEWFEENKKDRLNTFLEFFGLKHSKKELKKIYPILKKHLYTEPLSNEETLDVKSNIPIAMESVVKLPEYKFIEPTNSILFDLSIFIGELLIHDFSTLFWDIETNLEFVDYNYLIVKNEAIPKERFCPLFSLETIAIQLYENRIENSLEDSYTIWEKNFNGKMPDYMSMIDDWLK